MAQFGRALRSGRRGRKFKSCHLDHISFKPHFYAVCLFITSVFSAVPLSSVCLFSAGFSSGLGSSFCSALWERASSPRREFSFRFPLLYLAFFDFGYKNTALFKSGKIIKFGSDLCRTLQKTAVFVKFAFKPSAINCTRV